jgi:hypothetical protein
MSARLVDWLLLLVVGAEVFSGLTSFLIGHPGGRWLFVVHGILGLALLVLLYWKLERVYIRLVEPRRWKFSTLAALLALLAVLLTIGAGVGWSTWHWPLGYPNGMNWHVIFGLLLALFMTWHLLVRYKPLRRRDLQGRRTVLHLLGMLVTGNVLWQAHEEFNRAIGTPGARRRFTGSHALTQGRGNAAFPVTMWLLDNPAPVAVADWQLQVHGAARQPRILTYAQMLDAPSLHLAATLDCTSGWYTTQQWQGISVAWLLDQVQPTTDVMAVGFVSITGYRWSLPMAEARQTLLATHVGGEALDHGHGGPLRLVAPGRRGFQWVKWINRVELLTAPDYGQWLAIFTSGVY